MAVDVPPVAGDFAWTMCLTVPINEYTLTYGVDQYGSAEE